MRYLSIAFVAILASFSPAAPPPPPDFSQPQSPAKPAPFPIKYVDQGQYDPRLRGYQTPEGFKLEIVSTEPTVVNPVGMTFAPDGRLFVLEWKEDPYNLTRWFEFKETFHYRDGTTRQVATMKKWIGDPLKELTLNGATGQYDAAKVIVMDELPSTVLYHDGWMYLTGRGTVRRYKQSKPGGLWDVKETIAQGFCGYHHHQVSGLTIGNDGKLYITSGDDDNVVEGSDGSRATVLRTGAVFRCNPDGSQMEVFSLGYRNPYRDVAQDEAFNLFHADNDNEDGSRFTGCRIMHVAEESDYGWRLKIGARCCQSDNTRGAVAGELPGKLPPMTKTGRGSPAGLLIYNDTRLPKQYRGLMYYPDVFRKLVRAYQVKPVGSTFEISGEFEFLKTDDPLFRPCQMVTGPDGAIYVCDWRTDSGGAGKLWGDGKNGRIYRLRWVGTKDQPELPLRGMDSWANLQKASDADLVNKLAAADFSDRLIARDELIRRGPASRPLVLKAFDSLPPAGRLPAMGVLQSLWTAEVEALFTRLVADESTDVRRVAVEALGLRGSAAAKAVLQRAVRDPQPAVRRAAVLALPRVAGATAVDAVLTAWKADDGKDVFLADAYLRALERTGKPGIDALAKAADAGDPALRDRVVTAFTALRTKPAADALEKLVAAPTFTPGQRAALIRSYSNYLFEPMPSLQPLAESLAADPATPLAVRMAAVDVLAGDNHLGGAAGTKLVFGLLDSDDADARITAIQAVELVRLKETTPKLLAIAADVKRSVAERSAAVRAVRVTGDASAASVIRTVLHAPHESVAFRAEALRTLNALDKKQATAIAEELLNQSEPTLLAEAVAVLGNSKDGAKLLGEQYVAKKLPAELWPRVSEALRKFASDPAIAKLNSEVKKGGLRLSMSPDDLAKIRETVLVKGDAGRGRELFLNASKLACVTCHHLEGFGGQVGPDLTRVWDTQTVDKLLESLAQPSKEIKEGYQAYRIDTVDGQVFTGLKVSETPKEVVLREASGRDVRVKREDVDKLAPSKSSLMPDDAVSQLTYEEFIDLLAFLKSRDAQESLRGTVLEYAVTTGYDPDMKKTYPLEMNPDPLTKPLGGDPWQLKHVEPAGLLSLKPTSAAKPASSYALVYVYSPRLQKAVAVVRTNEAVRVWVGKDIVMEQPARTGPIGEAKVPVELPKGWSPVLVKVGSAGPLHQLGMRFLGDGIRTAAKPE
ncbi:PVC-type heme-binding CxxCH protein [Limnoglobus roseus]|uniref:Putative beta-propeller-type glycoside hydrolase n=1 Tax=Limnoglobus roseus TaxID=2598579 RepID=A0A5C1AE60_9BACT|nr:PVC-type heme-binding CxxCH protein [Limnoglobus roseus]QEL16306.1 putative beta-propeller-type glycoside hydrolase [Limnoglobus roseus]